MSSIIGVAQLNRYISLKLKGDAKLSGLTVRGELSDFKVHFKSGHAYFSLKEDNSQIKCVMFRGSFSRVRFAPENGMKVLCTGNIEVYEPGGVYQVIVSELVPLGIGEAFLRIENTKKKLAALGYFDEQRKKPLPPLPKRIAVVTSLNGAALQDVLNILGRRYPVGEVTIFPAQMQGDTAHTMIAETLRQADRSGADVLILTRGGGSYEDLMPFNTEEVVTAAALCDTPLITAVGHETDTTLVDYAADVRAPTPSAAAEICAPEVGQLLSLLADKTKQLEAGLDGYLRGKEMCLDELTTKLSRLTPEGRLTEGAERLDKLMLRIESAAARRISAGENRLDSLGLRLEKAYDSLVNERASRVRTLSASLEALDPYRVLERGYTMTLKNGVPVTSADDITVGDELVIRFRDREVNVTVTGLTETGQ